MDTRYMNQHRPKNASWNRKVSLESVETAIESHRLAVHDGDFKSKFDCHACRDLDSRRANILQPPRHKRTAVPKKRKRR